MMATLDDLEKNWLQILAARPRAEQLYSVSYPAAQTLSALSLVVLNEERRWIKADPTDATQIDRAMGLLTTAIAMGDSGAALMKGTVSDPFWNFANGPLFLGVGGTIDQVPPQQAGSVFMRLVGSWIAPDSIFFDPEEGGILL